MGVTIHYSGSIDINKIPKLVALLKEICDTHGFKHKNPDPRYFSGNGMLITIEKDCDDVKFVFDENGHLHEFTKTQFAGLKAHLTVLAILKAVKERFMPNLSVRDETGFWEKRDFKELVNYFTESAVLIDKMVEAIEKNSEK